MRIHQSARLIYSQKEIEMTCTHIGNAIFCHYPIYRLRLEDGRNVWLEFHPYCGPTFFKDRFCQREIENWWDDVAICRAFDWHYEKYLKRVQ